MQVLIAGYGEMGRAMQRVLSPAHALRLWQRRDGTTLESQLVGVELVLLCVPALAHVDLLPRLAGCTPGACIATIAKGLDDQGRTPPEIMRALLPEALHAGYIYGPMIAERLQAGQPGFAGVAAEDESARDLMTKLFVGTALRTQSAADVDGLAWCAVLKNVYTIGISAAHALGLGENVTGALVVQAIAEMREVARRAGGEADTALGQGGLGDLVSTFSSADSNHQRIGRRLALEGPPPGPGEGVNTLTMIARHGRGETRDLPLFAAVAEAVAGRQRIGDSLANVL